MENNIVSIAIIGCGAVSELYHIPIASTSDKVHIAMLVDKNLKRVEALASKFGVAETTEDYTKVIGKVDATILALPHHLHAPVSIDLLNHGIHVLVEKPMALSTAECEAMISTAGESGATLAVGLVRRFFHAHQFVKKLISDGFLGKIESFDVREGSICNWPVASDFFVRKEAGGGALADKGAHTLDTMLWWLGDYESLEYFDDDMGGVEADCEIHLRMKNGAEGIVELSRTRNLRNTAIIRGEKGTLEVEMLGSQISIQPNGMNAKVIGNAIGNQDVELKKSQSVEDLMRAQLEDWIAAIHNQRNPYITGEEAAKSVALIEACYKARKPLEMPWLLSMPPKQNEGINLRGKKVLVTGGTGFIGGRLVERLVMDYGAEVCVLVRNFARTPRIARFPIKMVHGDITDLTAVRRAMEGCEIVFHCAYGNTGSFAQQREATVKGTENVLKAALEHNIKRVVYVSTISVYGQTKGGDLDESAPRKYSKKVYADTKLEAETLAFDYFKTYGLPVSIIQPTIVYGPFAPVWTIGPINQLKTGRVILVEDGGGLCNAVYVDDVVQAMLLAATKDEAIGQAFLISAEEPVTWREFYDGYEKMLGVKSTISMSLSEIRDFNRRYKREHRTINQVITALRENPHILHRILQLPAVNKSYRIAKAIVPNPLWNRLKNILLSNNMDKQHISPCEKPILPLTEREVDSFRAHTRVRIDKVKHLLGYQPNFNLEQGMNLTEKWLRFANWT